MKPSLTPLILALSLLAIGSQAGAVGRLTDLSVVDRDSGQQLTTYYHQGQYYVVGTPGNRYAVALRNTRGERLMTVVSVDGVNVVNGKTASPDQGGYVLEPNAATEINGWRKNMNEVAAFVFSPEQHSYAARTGRPDNVGVIGIAVFRERPEPRRVPDISNDTPWSSDYPSDTTTRRDRRAAEASPEGPSARSGAAPAAPAQEANNRSMDSSRYQQPRLGTAHGQREGSEVRYTDFIRASSRADELISIRYDSYRNLVAKGVIPVNRSSGRPVPNPFPGQFVPDPG